MINTKKDFINTVKPSILDGKFVTPKHNPNYLYTYKKQNRSVLSFEVVKSLHLFFTQGNYELTVYRNKRYSNDYFKLEPNDKAYSIPASGVVYQPNNNGLILSPLDSIVIVNGYKQGFHPFGESTSKINREVQNGNLIYKGNLK